MLAKIFYVLKPFISRRMQFRLRRILVRTKLKKYSSIWPINEKASRKPEWFKGWPGGKKFALLLTHDVELAGGMADIAKLIAIDEKYKIASSFGLVPERYTVTPKVLDLLRAHNRGIYVHDLNHDGRLFSSYALFKQRAPKINTYLQQWKVDGFRAGAMHHNLDWIGELNIKYDMSTFDTDPFEPMPDGVDTIFPFVAASPSTNRSYVEIPYTLPQDLMTLVLHPARSIDIWKRKFDWIVKHNGMVSVNVHPDYIAFDESKQSFNNYPVKKYEEFLAFIHDNYRDIMWNPNPSELCDFTWNAAVAHMPNIVQ